MASAQFEILKDNLMQLKRPDDDNLTVEQQDAIIQRRVKISVIHHNHIIEFISYIEDMYSNVIFVQFLCSIIIMCVTGFQVFVMPPSRIHYITLVLYFFCNLTQIAIYSWFGHDILTKSGGIGLACYMTEWNAVSPKTRKLISIIMERSKIPIILTAGKFFNLSLSTFMMILRTSYSYLAVLQQMYKTNTLVRFISTKSLQNSNIEKSIPLQQFRLKLDANDYAMIEYAENDKHVDLVHTVVPPNYKGQGIGNILAEKTFDHIINENKKMVLTCTFLQKFYKQNKNTYEAHVIE
ncbi:hypothetical protein Trydic_g19167 [Trypoxylus dichotomus]